MAEDPKFLTAQGAADLRAELEELVSVKRPALAAQLKEAISQGDLSENADYHDAKEQQAFLEGRILYLEGLLRSATIIDESGAPGGTLLEVQPGTTVTVQMDGEPEETYRIVGTAEADPRNGKISHESPLGAALLGRRKGDVVRFKSPDGDMKIKILKITR